jgi:hypothetical protein
MTGLVGVYATACGRGIRPWGAAVSFVAWRCCVRTWPSVGAKGGNLVFEPMVLFAARRDKDAQHQHGARIATGRVGPREHCSHLMLGLAAETARYRALAQFFLQYCWSSQAASFLYHTGRS